MYNWGSFTVFTENKAILINLQDTFLYDRTLQFIWAPRCKQHYFQCHIPHEYGAQTAASHAEKLLTQM